MLRGQKLAIMAKGGLGRKPLVKIGALVAALCLLGLFFLFLGAPAWTPLFRAFVWYAHWFGLGIHSTIGFGDASHTFLFQLGPFIARVASSAYVCKSTHFSSIDITGVACPHEPYDRMTVGILAIFCKVFWPSFFWGLGSAVGELPAYISARSYHILLSASKTPETSWGSRLASRIRKYASQGLIVLLASLPSALLEVTGLICGFAGIPWETFAPAFFVGKVLIRPALQVPLWPTAMRHLVGHAGDPRLLQSIH